MVGRRGSIIVVSAPSGAGKSTIVRGVMATMDGLAFSVSTTTRPPRSGELDGREYFFTDRLSFEEMVSRGAFLEWAEVHGNLYGTSRELAEAHLSEGRDLLLDIDVQGALQVKRLAPQAVLVFVLPPSMQDLEKRLTGREGSVGDAVLRRLRHASEEILSLPDYDYVVVNDVLELAVQRVRHIICASRNRTFSVAHAIAPILESFGVHYDQIAAQRPE